MSHLDSITTGRANQVFTTLLFEQILKPLSQGDGFGDFGMSVLAQQLAAQWHGYVR